MSNQKRDLWSHVFHFLGSFLSLLPCFKLAAQPKKHLEKIKRKLSNAELYEKRHRRYKWKFLSCIEINHKNIQIKLLKFQDNMLVVKQLTSAMLQATKVIKTDGNSWTYKICRIIPLKLIWKAYHINACGNSSSLHFTLHHTENQWR